VHHAWPALMLLLASELGLLIFGVTAGALWWAAPRLLDRRRRRWRREPPVARPGP